MAKSKAIEAVRSHHPHARVLQPIVVRSSSAPTHHRKGGKHHLGKGAASSQKVIMQMVIGGAVLGFLDKPGTLPATIPTIPLLGKAGTIALAAHFFGKGKPGIITDVRNAAATIAGYEFTLKGSISGDEV